MNLISRMIRVNMTFMKEKSADTDKIPQNEGRTDRMPVLIWIQTV